MKSKINYFQNASRFTESITHSVWYELPLFLSTFLLWGSETFRAWNGFLCLNKDYNFGDYLGRLCIVAVFGLCFVMISMRGRWQKVRRTLCYVIVIGLFLLAVFLRKSTGMDITPSALQLLMETNSGEVGDFINSYILGSNGLLLFTAIIVAILIVIVIEKLWQKVRNKSTKQISSLWKWLLILTVGYGIFAMRTYVDLFACQRQEKLVEWYVHGVVQAHDPISKILYSVKTLHVVHQQIGQSVEATRQYVEHEQPTPETDSLTLVLIIGESHIRDHCSLYGYHLHTAPFMESEQASGNLVAFRDAITPVSITSGAMKQILFTGAEGHQPWYEGVYFPAVFHSAGYHVAFFDNQTTMGTGAERGGEDYTILSPMYHPEIAAISYDVTNKEDFPYDEGIVEAYKKATSQDGKAVSKTRGTEGNRLVIFHLRGQHFEPSARFPKEKRWQHFKKEDYSYRHEPWMTDAKRQTIADYDNATLYNDYVIESIIKLFRDERAVIVYLSDHGAECYDYRDNDLRKHGTMEPKQMELLLRVPLIVWMSDKYKTTFPDIAARVEQSTTARFMTDDLPQLLFTLGKVKTSLYIPSADPTNAVYRPKKRRIPDGQDFDIFTQQGK